LPEGVVGEALSISLPAFFFSPSEASSTFVRVALSVSRAKAAALLDQHVMCYAKVTRYKPKSVVTI
jgi:hypothetical protein